MYNTRRSDPLNPTMSLQQPLNLTIRYIQWLIGKGNKMLKKNSLKLQINYFHVKSGCIYFIILKKQIVHVVIDGA